MSRDLTTTILNAIDDSVVHPLFAVELLFDNDAIRMWTGQGTLDIGGNDYIGVGNILDISAIEETAEMAVKGATITLSGVSSEALSLALSEPYQGRVCNIYFGVLTKKDDYSVGGAYPGLVLDFVSDYYDMSGEAYLASLNQIFSGYMDQMNIADGGETCTVELTVENRLIDLERARVARFTSGYQKSLYPDDLGLDFIEDLQDKDIVWGRKSGS